MLSTVASPRWSPQALAIWGKTDATSGHWLRLTTHLEDSARVMDHLWETLPESIARKYILWAESDTHARTLLAFLAGVHDVGKASTFQLKAQHVPGSDLLPDFSSRLRGVGVELPTVPDLGVRHGAVGQIALHDWLKTQHGWNSLVATRFAGIVGGHHGVNPASKDLQDIRNRRHTWDSPSLNAVRLEVLEKMAEFTGALPLLPDWATRKLPIELQVLTEALVIQTDWIASNTELFPLIDGEDGADRAVEEHLGGLAHYAVPDGGYFYWLRLPEHMDGETLAARAPAFKVGFRPGQRFSGQQGLRNYIRLSFAYYEDADLAEGARRLRALIDAVYP